jgi:hypothetical protein
MPAMTRTDNARNAALARANLRTALILGAIALGFFLFSLWRGV